MSRRVELFFSPGYSPELNPDKEVWNYVKRQIGRGAIWTQVELKARAFATAFIAEVRTNGERILHHPECRYAT